MSNQQKPRKYGGNQLKETFDIRCDLLGLMPNIEAKSGDESMIDIKSGHYLYLKSRKSASKSSKHNFWTPLRIKSQ